MSDKNTDTDWIGGAHPPNGQEFETRRDLDDKQYYRTAGDEPPPHWFVLIDRGEVVAVAPSRREEAAQEWAKAEPGRHLVNAPEWT